MSGEAILTPAPAIATAAVLAAAPMALLAVGTLGTSVLLAKGVRVLIDQRVEAARKQMETEKRQRAERWAAQLAQHQAGEALARDRAAGRAAERQLAQQGLREVRARQADAPTAAGFGALAGVATDAADPAIAERLDEVIDLLEALPVELQESKVGQRLERQAQGWREQSSAARPAPVTLEEIDALRDTVQRTRDHHRERLEQEAADRAQRLQRAETLLEDALFFHHLAGGQPELATLVQRLDAALAQREIAPASLALLEQRIDALKQDIARTVALDSLRPALREATLRHLRALGYAVLADFPATATDAPARAVLRVPEGEQIEVAVHPDGRLAFRLRHERAEPSSTLLTDAEQALLRRQEVRWCGDMRTLLRGLAAEGFALSLTFERAIPDRSIQIAVLETPAEWDTRDEEVERRERARFVRPERGSQQP